MFPDYFTYKQALQNNASIYFTTLQNLVTMPFMTNQFSKVLNEEIHIDATVNDEYKQLVLFTDNNLHALDRYKYLAQKKVDYIPQIEVLDNEFKVNDKTSPVAVLDINNTITLKEYVANINMFPELLNKLQQDIELMLDNLTANKIAHGNLTFESIRVKNEGGLLFTHLQNLYTQDLNAQGLCDSNYVETANKDVISKGLILAVLESEKSDPSSEAENMVFNFTAQDLNSPQTTIPYTLLLSSGNEEIQKLLDFKFHKEELTDGILPQTISNPEQIEPGKTLQEIQITSNPTGISVRDIDYNVLGRTPFLIKLSQTDKPYKLILTHKNEFQKVDVFPGMRHVALNFLGQETNSISQNNTESIVTPLEENEKKSDNSLMWVVAILFIALISTLLVFSANRDIPTEEIFAVEETAEAIDSAVTGAYYDPYESYDPYDSATIDSEALIEFYNVSRIRDTLINLYNCTENKNIECILNNFSYPLYQYYDQNNVDRSQLKNIFTNFFNNFDFIHVIDWENTTFEQNNNGTYTVNISGIYFKSNKNFETRVIINDIAILDENYKIISIFKN